MSVLIERQTQSGLLSVARAVGAGFASRFKALAVSMTRRKQIEALGGLDDRMLADIGVTRADLEEAARWSLWGDPGERLTAISEERRAARSRLG
ncbi:DUF1127 domain-containing protein [Chenggangzhangella methanolivorans]|uniref:DUF1127 domain-containing protein n=1 Tax=Chenggangzhangella methanolivorans TaxID=1437009 RepID=A0A9E6RCZ7_9HYPH|nr:DUF1127 domain-containing protein [Chenggangzhangella methanolivorans]QZN98760.1 DUF1127 domain-containing protein [Chenggangzhangella methanolivorans]